MSLIFNIPPGVPPVVVPLSKLELPAQELAVLSQVRHTSSMLEHNTTKGIPFELALTG